MPDPSPESMIAALTAENARLAAEAASLRVHLAAVSADADALHRSLTDAADCTRNLRAQLGAALDRVAVLEAQAAPAAEPTPTP